MTTEPPSAAIRRATAAPIPCAPAVTNATLPSNRCIKVPPSSCSQDAIDLLVRDPPVELGRVEVAAEHDRAAAGDHADQRADAVGRDERSRGQDPVGDRFRRRDQLGVRLVVVRRCGGRRRVEGDEQVGVVVHLGAVVVDAFRQRFAEPAAEREQRGGDRLAGATDCEVGSGDGECALAGGDGRAGRPGRQGPHDTQPVRRQPDRDRLAGFEVVLVDQQVGRLRHPVRGGDRAELDPLAGDVVVVGQERVGAVPLDRGAEELRKGHSATLVSGSEHAVARRRIVDQITHLRPRGLQRGELRRPQRRALTDAPAGEQEGRAATPADHHAQRSPVRRVARRAGSWRSATTPRCYTVEARTEWTCGTPYVATRCWPTAPSRTPIRPSGRVRRRDAPVRRRGVRRGCSGSFRPSAEDRNQGFQQGRTNLGPRARERPRPHRGAHRHRLTRRAHRPRPVPAFLALRHQAPRDARAPGMEGCLLT